MLKIVQETDDYIFGDVLVLRDFDLWISNNQIK